MNMNTNSSTDAKNPKDIAGTNRLDLTLVGPVALAEESLAMTEGMLKYGRANYIGTEVVCMIYMAAAERHLKKFIQGEERDPKTGVHHLGSARACIGIIIEAAAHGTLIDNRPPSLVGFSGYLDGMEDRVAHLKGLFADKRPYHYTIADTKPVKPKPVGPPNESIKRAVKPKTVFRTSTKTNKAKRR